jgi:tyrosinase
MAEDTMNQTISGRRRFLRNSAIALAVPTFPRDLLAQTTLFQRTEFQVFKTTTHYDALLSAITKMKANTNAADPNSWTYWVNIHLNRCPHGIPYFLGWHRGFLYYFENRLRTVSGDSQLILPYWDYYSYATLPAEFTNPAPTNPLYVGRVNTNVRQALTLAPFAPTIINFPRGYSSAFEPSVEGAPHDPVHDIIGGIMATMQSPTDPIFWLHHSNIDRLWVAWVAAGSGRKMPSKSSSYWYGSYTYTSTLTMLRTYTYDTRTKLVYMYANETMPTSIPLVRTATPQTFLAQATGDDLMTSIPPVGAFQVSGPRSTSDTGMSIGGARNVGLDEHSVSAQLPIATQYSSAVQTIMRGNSSTVPGDSRKFKSVRLVLDDVRVAAAGMGGGYYYQVYLNWPQAGNGPNRPASVLLGTLGPFQVSGAMHHGGGHVQLSFALGKSLAGLSPMQIGMATVSFVRISGDNSPSGPVMGIGEVRIELSTDDAQS